MGLRRLLGTIANFCLCFVICRAVWSSPVVTKYITKFLKRKSQGLKTHFPVRDIVATMDGETDFFVWKTLLSSYLAVNLTFLVILKFIYNEQWRIKEDPSATCPESLHWLKSPWPCRKCVVPVSSLCKVTVKSDLTNQKVAISSQGRFKDKLTFFSSLSIFFHFILFFTVFFFILRQYKGPWKATQCSPLVSFMGLVLEPLI